jgi:hypothetical protein
MQELKQVLGAFMNCMADVGAAWHATGIKGIKEVGLMAEETEALFELHRVLIDWADVLHANVVLRWLVSWNF